MDVLNNVLNLSNIFYYFPFIISVKLSWFMWLEFFFLSFVLSTRKDIHKKNPYNFYFCGLINRWRNMKVMKWMYKNNCTNKKNLLNLYSYKKKIISYWKCYICIYCAYMCACTYEYVYQSDLAAESQYIPRLKFLKNPRFLSPKRLYRAIWRTLSKMHFNAFWNFLL